MRLIRKLFANIHLYLLWAFISVILWVWLFGFITDAPLQKKIVIFADVAAVKTTEIDVALERELPDGIKIVRVHPFSYALMSSSEIEAADIYIVKGGDIDNYFDSFAPLSNGYDQLDDDSIYIRDGIVYGYKVFDNASRTGIATNYIDYDYDDYYLFFNVNSVHVQALNGSPDDAAKFVARKLMAL